MSFGNTVKDGSGAAYWLLQDSDGRLRMVGAAEHDASATGAPVRIAGVYRLSPPAVASGDTVDLLMDAAGRVFVADVAKLGGVAPQFDQTDRIAVSLYGQQSAAGDKAIAVDSNGMLRVSLEYSDVVLSMYGSLGDSQAEYNGGLKTYPHPAVYNGATWQRQRTPATWKVVQLAAGTSETAIWTPALGKKFRLMGFMLTCSAACTLTFRDGTGGSVIFVARGNQDQAISPVGFGNGLLSAAANNVLTVERGTSCALDGTVWGIEESA